MIYESEVFDLPSSTSIVIQGDCEDSKMMYYQCTHQTVEDIVAILHSNGFHQYFTSQQGGGYDHDYVRTWARRIGKFLNYSHYGVYQEVLSRTKVIEWIIELITTEYVKAFSHYMNYLTSIENFAPNTILTDLTNVKQFLFWFVYFRPHDGTESINITQMNLQPIEMLVRNLCKNQRKLLKKRLSSAPDMDDLICNRELPSGGLPALQNIIATDIEWWKSRDWKSPMIEKKTYDKFMMLLYSSLYVHSAQGRISAIEDIKWGQVNDLIKNGAVFSNKFKTNSTFGYQPVTTSTVSLNLIKFYVTILRPKVTSSMNGPHDPLFLHYDGTPATRIGDKVLFKIDYELFSYFSTIIVLDHLIFQN